MIPDPTAEIKRIRHQLGADDGFDLDRVYTRIQRLQDESGRVFIRRPARKPMAKDAMHPSGSAKQSVVENLSSAPGDG